MELTLYRVKIQQVEQRYTQWPSTGPTEAAQSYLEHYLERSNFLTNSKVNVGYVVEVEIDGKIILFDGKVVVKPCAVVELKKENPA